MPGRAGVGKVSEKMNRRRSGACRWFVRFVGRPFNPRGFRGISPGHARRLPRQDAPPPPRAKELKVCPSDCLRQPDNLRAGKPENARRLTALRPYLAAGLPLSCAIIALRKIVAAAGGDISQTDLTMFEPCLSSISFCVRPEAEERAERLWDGRRPGGTPEGFQHRQGRLSAPTRRLSPPPRCRYTRKRGPGSPKCSTAGFKQTQSIP